MNRRKNSHGMTSPQDEASNSTNSNELEKHRKLIHLLMNELRSEVEPLLNRLPPHERKELIEPLTRNLGQVVAAFSLETTPAINGELAHQLAVGSDVLGPMAHQIDWASDMGYLTWDEHERILGRVKVLLLGAQNLRWHLTGRLPAGVQRRSGLGHPACFH